MTSQVTAAGLTCLFFSGPFPCIPGPPPIPTGKRRRKRSLQPQNEALEAAAFVASEIMNHTNYQLNEAADNSLYLAALMAAKLWLNLQEQSPSAAFCGLYDDLDRVEGLDRAGASLLALAGSRLAFYGNYSRSDAMSCSQNVRFRHQGGPTILAWTGCWRPQQGCKPRPLVFVGRPAAHDASLEIFDATS